MIKSPGRFLNCDQFLPKFVRSTIILISYYLDLLRIFISRHLETYHKGVETSRNGILAMLTILPLASEKCDGEFKN